MPSTEQMLTTVRNRLIKSNSDKIALLSPTTLVVSLQDTVRFRHEAVSSAQEFV